MKNTILGDKYFIIIVMKNTIKITLLIAALTVFGDLTSNEIESNKSVVATKERVVEELSTIMPEATVLESEIPGIYSVSIGTMVGYVSEDGKYILRGDIYDMETNENITEGLRAKSRIELLKSINEESMVIFAPDTFDRTVTIFTDIDCGYCRKFHSQIKEVMEQGIRVRYLFFPRTGPGKESWLKAQKVWCSEDRLKAMTRAKKGSSIRSETCLDDPVESHYNTGLEFNVRGTPTLITDSGEMIVGYMEATSLRAKLDSES
jgi:thiol:disulfide interchange protein DsbC